MLVILIIAKLGKCTTEDDNLKCKQLISTPTSYHQRAVTSDGEKQVKLFGYFEIYDKDRSRKGYFVPKLTHAQWTPVNDNMNQLSLSFDCATIDVMVTPATGSASVFVNFTYPLIGDQSSCSINFIKMASENSLPAGQWTCFPPKASENLISFSWDAFSFVDI